MLALSALLTGGCGGESGPGAATTTTTTMEITSTTELRLSREEYVRQGDAVCAQLDQKLAAFPTPAPTASDEEFDRFYQETELVIRQFVDAFKALKAPLTDKATADQLNAYADNILFKEVQVTAAGASDDDAAADKAQAESEVAWDQFHQLAGSYGFVECSKDMEPAEPAG